MLRTVPAQLESSVHDQVVAGSIEPDTFAYYLQPYSSKRAAQPSRGCSVSSSLPLAVRIYQTSTAGSVNNTTRVLGYSISLLGWVRLDEDAIFPFSCAHNAVNGEDPVLQ